MLQERRDVDAGAAVGLVAANEPAGCQVVEQAIDVDGVVREEQRLQSHGPILESAGAVGDRPQADEEEPRGKTQVRKVLVHEEFGLDRPDPLQSHQPPSPVLREAAGRGRRATSLLPRATARPLLAPAPATCRACKIAVLTGVGGARSGYLPAF
jgi:hypothetical protein